MIGFVTRTAISARSRTALLLCAVAGVLCATVLLGGVAETSQAKINGSLAGAFRPAYDILVRPNTDVTAYEGAHHLVRDNFLSGLFGGISDRQLAAIRSVPGIEAAPVENVGYVLASETFAFPFRPPRHGPVNQLFRLSVTFSLPGEAVRWGSAYVYVSRSERFSNDGPATVYEDPAGSARIRVCGSQSEPSGLSADMGSPFTAGRLSGYITCYSEATPRDGSFPSGKVVVPVTVDFPLLLTAVDPRVEARWFGLRAAVTSGRYLEEGARAESLGATPFGRAESVPVLASSESYLDENLVLTRALVATSSGTSLGRRLSAGDATRAVAKLRPLEVSRTTEPAQRLYSALIQSSRGSQGEAALPVPEYWVGSQMHFHSTGHDSVAVSEETNGPEIWRSAAGWGGAESFTSGAEAQYIDAPPGNGPRGYEHLSVRDLRAGSSEEGTAGGPPVTVLDVVGEFDPRRLTGFDPASRVPLQTFYPPVATAGSRETERAIGGPSLGPTTDMTGYVAQPPSLLTTLQAARALLQSSRYEGASSGAPIAAVLVRLDGKLGTGPVSRARLEAAAAEIRQKTHLNVAITDGSSPTPVRVTLDGDSDNAKKLVLEEGWTRLGVTYDIVGALDSKTVGLELLAGVCGVLFIIGAVAGTMRSRRRELAVLLALGWSRRDLLKATAGEVLLVAAGGSAIGMAAALGGARLAHIHVAAPVALATAGVSVLVALVAGGVPCLAGTRYEVVRALAPVRRRAGARASRAGVALATITSAPGRTMLASAGLGLSVAGLAILVCLQRGFSHQLLATRTVLGSQVDLHVGGLDLAAALVVLVLGVAGAANTTLAGGPERWRAHVVLASVGWGRKDLVVLVVIEAAIVAGSGATLGAGLAVAVATGLHSPLWPTVVTALMTGALGLLGVLGLVAVPSAWRMRAGLVAAALAEA